MQKPLTGNGGSSISPAFRSVSQGQLEDRTLGVGSTATGTVAGKSRAVYADIDLTNVPDLNNVVVRHSLGETPTVCDYVEVKNTGATAVFASISPVAKHLWTHTTVRIAVSLTGATKAGTVLKVRVGGK